MLMTRQAELWELSEQRDCESAGYERAAAAHADAARTIRTLIAENMAKIETALWDAIGDAPAPNALEGNLIMLAYGAQAVEAKAMREAAELDAAAAASRKRAAELQLESVALRMSARAAPGVA
jgi:hypothetical protein